MVFNTPGSFTAYEKCDESRQGFMGWEQRSVSHAAFAIPGDPFPRSGADTRTQKPRMRSSRRTETPEGRCGVPENGSGEVKTAEELLRLRERKATK